ncbi:hypothetical protein LOTGIDRAFT_165842 [Lottia gigantea]|uniref:G-protein coupled receptors family 1 profile domain-containing protein n=1 Tax=Lottia gigantea TaxID=225164 RepID=V3ZZL0_LOTGI|nr:hypothetical protein LOTGIDRAFT_165842 [Lottia gigantea]ESO88105.1 hypothetical protein LOTGIDRAFT_165842 [Lottia gigantea]
MAARFSSHNNDTMDNDSLADFMYISLLITDLTTALSGAFIFLLHIDYLAFNNTTSIYPGKRLIGPVLLSFFCYIITGAMLVPLYVLHLQPETYDISTGNCWPFNREGTFLLYEALSVVPHCLLILVSGGMTIGAYISRSYLLNISKELNLVRRPVDLNLAGALTVLLHCVPYLYSIVNKLVCVCLQCSEMTGLDILIPLLPFFKCVILPFVWLFCPDFRTALSLCCTKRQKRVTIKLPAEIENNRIENHTNETNNSKSPKLKTKAEPTPPAIPESEVIESIPDENNEEKVLMV